MIAPWEARLAAARRLTYIDAPSLEAPPALADQVSSAASDAAGMADNLFGVLRAHDPDGWRRQDVTAGRERRALILAGLLGIEQLCWHLRRQGPQPAVIALALRRADCRRCSETTHRPVTGPDECDLCGTTGVARFTPVAITTGPVVIVGDVCAVCAHDLGLPTPAQGPAQPAKHPQGGNPRPNPQGADEMTTRPPIRATRPEGDAS